MKKILLASTILVGSAGIAAADNANFTFDGAAYFGGAYSTALGGFFALEVEAEFTAGMMTTTDMGLEAGANITVSAAGMGVQEDHTEFTFGLATTSAAAISDAEVYLSGDWGTLTVEYDNNGTADILGWVEPDVTLTYDNTWGDFGVEAYYTWAADVNGFFGFANGFAGQSNGDAGASVSYTMGDYGVSAGINWDNSVGDWDIDLGADASMNGFGVEVNANYDNATADWDFDATASYATGPYSVSAFVEEDDGIDTALDFGASAAYDLGGGVSVEGAVVYDNDWNDYVVTLGVAMAF